MWDDFNQTESDIKNFFGKKKLKKIEKINLEYENNIEID
jgi:hypothetical protein